MVSNELVITRYIMVNMRLLYYNRFVSMRRHFSQCHDMFRRKFSFYKRFQILVRMQFHRSMIHVESVYGKLSLIEL